jgi:hypothetical protein
VPRGRAKSARLRSRAGAHSRTAGSVTEHAWLKGRRRSGSRWAMPRYHPTPGNRSETKVRDESRTPTGPDGAKRAGGETSWSPLPRHPRGVREERHGSETQIGRRRPHRRRAERRCRSGEGSRIGRDAHLFC